MREGEDNAPSRAGSRSASWRYPRASAESPPAASGSESPEAAVKAYLGALQSGDFAAAYEQLTPQMRRTEPKEKWVGEQTLVMKLGEVQISSFQVFPARTGGRGQGEGAEPAQVQGQVHQPDGADEYELYTLVAARTAAGASTSRSSSRPTT